MSRFALGLWQLESVPTSYCPTLMIFYLLWNCVINKIYLYKKNVLMHLNPWSKFRLFSMFFLLFFRPTPSGYLHIELRAPSVLMDYGSWIFRPHPSLLEVVQHSLRKRELLHEASYFFFSCFSCLDLFRHTELAGLLGMCFNVISRFVSFYILIFEWRFHVELLCDIFVYVPYICCPWSQVGKYIVFQALLILSNISA